MSKYLFKGKKKNRNEWVTGNYLYNEKTGNHLIATLKSDANVKSTDYGTAYDFWLVDPETVEVV